MKWFAFILLATLSNGIVLSSMKAIHQYSSKESKTVYFVGLCSAMLFCSLINMKFKVRKLEKKELLVGIGMGIFLILGTFFVTLALEYMTGTFVYTVVNGGAVILISIVAVFLFKEKYSPIGVIGIIFGIISIILMGL